MNIARSSPLAALLRATVRHNPLFLLSALALLGGVWLQNPPGSGGGRPAEVALPLLLAVRGYELTLLVAMLLLGRAGLGRDVRGLALVLTPFLVDVSRTQALAALLPETWPMTFLACGASFLVTAGIGAAAARLAGRRFGPGTSAGLLTPAALSILIPLASSFLTYRGATADEVALACGLGLAAAIAAVTLVAPAGADVRLVGGISLGVLVSHALGTAWSHTGSLLLVVGPPLIAAGPGLPRLLWPGRDDPWSPLLLPAAGALCCGLSGAEHLAAWPLGLGAWSAIAAVELLRRRSFPAVVSCLLALDLLLGGPSLAGAWRGLGSGPGEPAALLGLFAWGLVRRAHPLALGLPLSLATLLTWRLDLCTPALQAVLGLHVLGAGLLAWSHRVVAPGELRLLGTLLLVVPIHLHLASGAPEPGAMAVARGTLLGLLVLAALTRTRSYAWPALLVPVEVARRLAPRGAGGWSGLGIALGFGLVALGVAVSLWRERLLAWLEEAPPPPPEEAEASPAEVTSPGLAA